MQESDVDDSNMNSHICRPEHKGRRFTFFTKMTFLYHSILKEISRFTVFVITKKSQWFFNKKIQSMIVQILLDFSK